MKKNVLILISAMLALVTACSSNRTQGSSGDIPGLAEAIGAKNYVVSADMVLPMGGPSKTLSTPYSVTVKGDSVDSYLPYFGRAYSLPYGGGEGLIFKGKMTDYKVEYGRKGDANVSFEVRTDEDIYKFIIQIFPNGSSTINVNPNNKQSISFTGSTKPGEEVMAD